jgi:hypothetical protein
MKVGIRNDIWRHTWLALAFVAGTGTAARILDGQRRVGEVAFHQAGFESRVGPIRSLLGGHAVTASAALA